MAGTAFLLALGLTFVGPGGERAAPAYALTIGDHDFAVEMFGTGADGSLVFAGVCQGPIGPGDLCSETVTVTNVSPSPAAVIEYELSVNVAPVGSLTGLLPCFNVGLVLGSQAPPQPAVSSIGPLSGPALVAGESGQWQLSAAVSEDDRCQGARALVVVTLNATAAGDGSGSSADADGGDDDGATGGSGTGSGDAGGSGGAQPPRSPLDGAVPSGLPSTGSGGWTNVNDSPFSVLALFALGFGCALLLIGGSRSTRRRP